MRGIALWLCTLLIGIGLISAAASQSSRGIAVLYPDIGEPYRGVFAKMIEGIEERTRGRVATVAIGTNPNQQEIANELRRQDVHVVIALGRNGLKVATNLERDIDVVVGGVISVPEAEMRNFTVSSLAPDPALLFARLKIFMPAVRRVFVVYDPTQSAWLMRMAKAAASARGIELLAYEAGDLKTTLQHYQTILATMDAARDSLWLPLDATTVNETTVLPLVLKEAWARNLAVFSSNVAHVRRGALFSLFPDNHEVGRILAEYALGYLTPGEHPARGMVPSKAVQLAVNVRTATHLGIDVADKQTSFDLVFPER
jgi:putative tryptophan/tyrosine transport system substrate-binding protein